MCETGQKTVKVANEPFAFSVKDYLQQSGIIYSSAHMYTLICTLTHMHFLAHRQHHSTHTHTHTHTNTQTHVMTACPSSSDTYTADTPERSDTPSSIVRTHEPHVMPSTCVECIHAHSVVEIVGATSGRPTDVHHTPQPKRGNMTHSTLARQCTWMRSAVFNNRDANCTHVATRRTGKRQIVDRHRHSASGGVGDCDREGRPCNAQRLTSLTSLTRSEVTRVYCHSTAQTECSMRGESYERPWS